MKLRRLTEGKPRPGRAQDVLGLEVGAAAESPIPWEAMQQEVKSLLVDSFERQVGVPSFMDVSRIHGTLLLFPELRSRLHITREQFNNLTTFGDPQETDYFHEIPHLIGVFPERREWILGSLENELEKAEQRLQTAAAAKPPDFSELVSTLSYTPQYLKDYQPLLQQGKDVLLQSLKEDLWRYEWSETYKLVNWMSTLTLFFPDLRADIQRLAAERRSDILKEFDHCKETDKDGTAAVNSLVWILVGLKIIYAESAGFSEDGTIFIEDKKNTGPRPSPLPSRDLAA